MKSLLVQCLTLLFVFMEGAKGLLPNLRPPRPHRSSTNLASSSDENKSVLERLKVAVVGAGPAGLLLSHRLAMAGATVSVFESRPYPDLRKEPRAYALGVGRRGRTAIQSAGNDVWRHIRDNYGYPSERFQLHIGPLSPTLRDGQPGGMEPSLLLFQTDLCRGLAELLREKYPKSINVFYDTKIDAVQLRERTLITQTGAKHTFDVVFGCDGVNSIVRNAFGEDWTSFETSRNELPGVFKVAKVDAMPPGLDPTAVALILPKAGACTAFVEPIHSNKACILFASRNESDTVLGSTDATLIAEELDRRFPRLRGLDLASVGEQLASNTLPSKTYSVQCNIYNYAGLAALVGDAAHATGGVSGQGVNSALVDAAVLSDVLAEHYDSSNKQGSLRKSLLEYSKRQVPEGMALYDLSFGPKPSSKLKKIKASLISARDTLFRGRFGIGEAPLQTQLTTSLTSFASLRRRKDKLYDQPFPSQSEFDLELTNLDSSIET